MQRQVTAADDATQLASWRVGQPEDHADTEYFLLHHGHTASHDTWLPVAHLLAARRPHAAVILFDARGAGASESPAGLEADGRFESAEGFSMADYAADALRVLAAWGVPPSRAVTVCGHSMGGLVSLELALRHPERVQRLVLAAPACPDAVGAIPATFMQAQKKARARARTDEAAFAEMLRAQAAMSPRVDLARPQHRELLARFLRVTLSCSDAHWERSWAGMAAWAGDLGEVRVPTLLIVGACDSLLRFNLMQYRLLRKTAALAVLHRIGHGVPREAAVEVADLIEEFCEHGVVTARTLSANL